MDSETIFVKTAQGIEELERRTLGVGATLRRLLILINGQRTVAELVHENAGSIDVSSTLEQLRTRGLIVESGQEATATSGHAPAALADVSTQDVSVRNALIDMARSVLGEQHVERFASKLEGIANENDADELNAVIDKCVRLIRLTIDEDKAEDFRRQAEVIMRAQR